MNERSKALIRIILIGAVYAFVGIAFPNPSAEDKQQFWWRLGAWLICVIVFGIHILYEHFQLHNLPLRLALNVSLSVAIGGFALAIAANIHGIRMQTGNQDRLLLALIAWPAMTMAPAFLLAVIFALVVSRIKS